MLELMYVSKIALRSFELSIHLQKTKTSKNNHTMKLSKYKGINLFRNVMHKEQEILTKFN